MITVVIIEDEAVIQKEIAYLVSAESDTRLTGSSDSVLSAVQLIELQQPDIILMDIQLRDGTAFDIIRLLKYNPQNIIFITAYDEFAIRAIKCGALDYLLKPIDHSEFKQAFERYRKRNTDIKSGKQLSLVQKLMENRQQIPEHIALPSLNQIRIITVQEIMYCRGDGPYTWFYLTNGEEQLASRPLKYYEELLQPPYFLRTHQSYLVNRRYVSGISNSENLVLKNNQHVPVSARRKKNILQQLFPQ
ncbi:LytR/AlgR family response regulator transcription factor [Sphingobacterium spiritivorum]|uniref:LytR/AlgR family response regulator transcription factor n=1 Tax=Sphingobacterium spiritivorum TaxID=258 RepID=UPI00191A71D6|nr:LytTR family DNA-binding domain-containing protein [Sphingobacterium spiritivorum]QQT25541.1 response regulator transcription factor [Sphingobacterium spiritivorum]